MGGPAENKFVDQPVKLENGEEPELKEIIDGTVLPELLAHYIVSDETYEQLPEPSRTEGYTAWKAAKGQEEAVIQAGEVLSNELPYYFQANDYIIYNIHKGYGLIL